MQGKGNYRVLLFDADMTLFNFDRAEKESIFSTFAAYGIACDEKMYQDYRLVNYALWEDLNERKIEKEQIVTERFARLFALYGIRADAEAVNARYIRELGTRPYLLDGACELCERLAPHCTLAIVTNGVSEVQHQRMRVSPITKWISHVIVSDAAGYHKPEAAFFEHAMQRIGMPPGGKSELLMIGDSLTSDIQGGIRYGIDTCWYNPKHLENRTAIRPTYEIDRLDQLIPIAIGQKADRK